MKGINSKELFGARNLIEHIYTDDIKALFIIKIIKRIYYGSKVF